ncbi:MAG TPA: prolyl oligopeptidase family serine peptidase [Candidatus Acidoferrales bacterium]|nr:prolyl oligopeptidase family serine peptidase [Candidatus Acidoferrales bacterium]
MKAFAVVLAVASVIFGQTVEDPYRWLENAASPKVQAWVARQNARAEAAIDGYSKNAQIAARIEALSRTGPQRFDPQLAGTTLLFMQETPPQPQPVLMAQAWPGGEPRVVADPSAYGPAVSIDFVWPSPSGRLAALATSAGGSEAATIRVVAVDGVRKYGEALGPAGGGTTAPAVAWDAGDGGFTYARLPSGGSQFGIRLYHHVLGTPQSADTLALGQISPIAEYRLLVSANARRAAALVQFGDGAPLRVYLREGDVWSQRVGPGAGIVSGVYAGRRLLVVATAGTPHGRIAVVGESGTLRTLVPEARDWAYHDVAPIAGGFLVTASWGTRWRVDRFDSDGGFVSALPLPAGGIGINGFASSAVQPRALIAYSGWTTPLRWGLYDANDGSLRTVWQLQPASGDYRNVAVRTIEAISRDGTAVPVTVLAMKQTKFDGNVPTILTGYGGFDLSTEPYFVGSTLAWLEMGGAYAVANVRGGGEFGETWHRQGMLLDKQNVFDDFYAAARALVAGGYTTTSRLAVAGGSNGGLLVGAAGIYDVLRHHLFANGAYNVSEYGSVDDPAQFRALYAYSPYHHVRPGVAYPAVLLLTSENDPRVAAWQSWKFGAALQAATSSARPVLVLTRSSGGHGHGASFAQRVGNTAVEYSFVAAQLGL